MPPLRFLVDACVDVRLARWLREQGYDAIHLRDEGLHSLPNGQIFEKAITENRVVLTHDLDFGEICAMTHGRKASVIVFRLHNPALNDSSRGYRKYCRTAHRPYKTARS